ncbi:MAG: TolC family protein [Deltaproteobacteria bacterium]|nr:TolC family protein [Deltaproteobacteria bacterium]
MTGRFGIEPALCLLAAIIVACAGNDALSPRQPTLPLPPDPEPVKPPAVGSSNRDDSDTRLSGLGPLELSLEGAAISALRNNRDLRVRKLTAEVQAAVAESAQGKFDTELFADFQYGQERTVESARSTEEQFDVEGRQTSSVLGVRQKFSTGTELEASVEHEFSASSRTPEQQRARLGLTVTQALLRGFGPEVNLAEIEQADLEVQASRHELRGYAETIISETELAYWRYVLAEREIAIYQESLEVTRRQRDEIEQEIEVGTLAQMESAAASAEVALREQELIEARSIFEQQRLRLLRVVGADLGRKLIATSDPSLKPEPVDDLDERLKLAERSRAEINEALLRLEEKRLETVVTRNGLLPRLDFFITLGKTGFAADFPGSFRQLTGDTFDILGGLSLSYMVQGSAAQGANRAAFASRKQAERALDNLRQMVRLEVQIAATEVERARQQISASAATRKLQEQKVLVEQERFRVGESTALMLAQAQRDLLSSRIAEIKALVDYRSALVELYRAEGTLLERRGIRVGN